MTAAAAHWLYTHPDQAVEILRKAQTVAPLAFQAAKQGANFYFHPDTGVMPVGNGDVYQNEPSFEMSPESKSNSPDSSTSSNIWETYSGASGLDQLAENVIRLEGDSDVARRNNNPGNLKSPSGGFLKFTSPEAGKAALMRQLKRWRDNNPDWTVAEFNANYAPDASRGGDNPDGNESRRNQYLMVNARR